MRILLVPLALLLAPLATAQDAALVFEDQTSSGDLLVVAQATLPAGGFVVVHGEGGAIVGASAYLAPGTHDNVSVEADFEPGALTAMLHNDTDADEAFDAAVDEPLVGAAGPVTDQAIVARGDAATVRFEDQDLNATLVVAHADLPEGGFIAIHDDRLLGGGLGGVLGASSYLEPGEHSDIRIAVALDEKAVLFAVPHYDSNANRAFDFVPSGGTLDRWYMAGGEPVSDSARIQAEGESTTVGLARDGEGQGNDAPLPVGAALLAALAAVALRRRASP